MFFRSVSNFFFEKQTPQIVFSIQNGEISILNGDFSIYFCQTCFEFFFEKKTLQRVFSVQNGEISILNGDFSIHMFLRSVLFF